MTTTNAGATAAPIDGSLVVNDRLTVRNWLLADRYLDNYYDHGEKLVVRKPAVLTIRLVNTNPVPITGVTFTDAYEPGLVNTTPLTATSDCGGVLTASPGGPSIALAGGTIPANGNCTIMVRVASAIPNTYTDRIGAGAVSSDNGGTNTTSAVSASLLIYEMLPPTVTKIFSPLSVKPGQTSTLTFTLTNYSYKNYEPSIEGVSFTDTYPAGLVNAAAPNATSTCGGVVTAAPGGGSLALTGGFIPRGDIFVSTRTCTVSVTVTSNTAGVYTNTIGAAAVASFNARTNPFPASAMLIVNAAPPLAVALDFSPPAGDQYRDATLTVVLANPGGTPITGTAFTLRYPAGLVNKLPGQNLPADASTTCAGGTAAAVVGGASLALSGATIPANGSCVVTVTVRGSNNQPSYTVTMPAGAISSTSGISNPLGATATLVRIETSASALSAQKAFVPADITPGQTSTLTITLSNSSNSNALEGVSFTDTYPPNLVNAAAPNAATTCGAGVVTAAAGGNSVALAGGVIPPSGPGRQCTVTVQVTASAANTYVNTIGAGEIKSSNGDAYPGPISASLEVVAPLTVSRSGTGGGTVDSVDGSIACGNDCAQTYYAGTQVTLTATPDANSIFAGWLGSGCTGTATTCTPAMLAATNNVTATFAPQSYAPLRIDIDNNHSYGPLTDGLLILRYLFGMAGNALIANAVGPNAGNTTPAQIQAWLANIRPLLDIDGNGQADALSDGILTLRYLLGIRGQALIAGAIGVGATRTTAPVIEAYIGSILP